MTQARIHNPNTYRRLWRFFSDHPALPESQRWITSRLAEKFEASSDPAVEKHIKFLRNATDKYQKDATKSTGTVPYYVVSEPGIDGIFCPNELSVLAQDMLASSADFEKGGRNFGYNDPDIDRHEVASDYVMYIAQFGNKSEAARQVCLDHWGPDENDDLPCGDQLRALVRRLDRWRKEHGL